MIERNTDLNKNFLSKEDELEIIYDGPSFNGQMEISRLRSQLKSTEYLIKELVFEYYNQKGYKENPDVKIYLKLKKGSFQEIISIVLDKELIQNVISGCLIALFTYFLTKKNLGEKEKTIPQTQIKIDKFINNVKIVRHIKHLSDPLEEEGDKIKILSKQNSNLNTEIKFSDKNIFKEKIKEMESELKISYSEEEFFGKLRAVDLDKESYRFSLEGTQNSVPVEFNEEINSETIGHILDKRIKVKAIATKRNEDLDSLKVLSFEEKRVKTLGDFTEG